MKTGRGDPNSSTFKFIILRVNIYMLVEHKLITNKDATLIAQTHFLPNAFVHFSFKALFGCLSTAELSNDHKEKTIKASFSCIQLSP